MIESINSNGGFTAIVTVLQLINFCLSKNGVL